MNPAGLLPKNECFLLRQLLPEGGGNRMSSALSVRRTAALGDVLSSTVVVDRLRELGFEISFQTHPHCAPLLRYVPGINHVAGTNGYCHVNLDGAYERHPHRRTLHFNDAWFFAAANALSSLSVDLGKALNARPRLKVSKEQRAIARAKWVDAPRPIILICPGSQYYRVRTVPDRVWQAAAKEFPGTTYWIGLSPAPPGIKDLEVRSIDSLVSTIAAADMLVTTDTGPMHIAAALDTRVLVIGQSSDPALHLTDQNDWQAIYPDLDCLNCQENLCPKDQYLPPCQAIDPAQISQTVRDSFKPSVSAVIPIYQPETELLNACLEAVLPQVDEIIITKEALGKVPPGTITNPRIRHVTHPGHRIGFGRNVNFGFRHTHGEQVLVLNDDVILDHDAVVELQNLAGDGVGIIGQFLKYPDGRIYHAGKPRAANGGIGFPHIDLGKYLPSITQPCEMENTNGASILVNRKAFYEVGGFDERFLFYAEDDDLAMRMRKNGWQVWYQPNAQGTHHEHAETKKMSDMHSIMAESNRLFGTLWGEYFRHNAKNPGLGNFGYLKAS